MPNTEQREIVERIPFSTFRGQLKQIDTSQVPPLFDLFFPRFRTEHEWRKAAPAIISYSSRTSSMLGRGRERRFAGDETLPRGRYYCIVDSERNNPANNTMLGELFAYADPAMPVQPEFLDTTVDTDQAAHIKRILGWDIDVPAMVHIISRTDNPWTFSPCIGIGPEGLFARYPMVISEHQIDNVIDLRLPATLDWLMKTFVRLEEETKPYGDLVRVKGDPPSTLAAFLPILLAQQLGGGSAFIQGIGAWLRVNGVNAIIYPSARSDSLSVVRDGTVVESFGHILLDLRNAPPLDYDPRRYFGSTGWAHDKHMESIVVTEWVSDDDFDLHVSGLRTLQEVRFAMYHDWIVQTLGRAQSVLHSGTEKLADPVNMVMRPPSEVLDPERASILGKAKEFIIEEGGGAFAVGGFLFGWRHRNNATFIAGVLPLALDHDWDNEWHWDGNNWFLHRRCHLRPWVVIKCPVCYFEQFWNVTKGTPEESCFRCKFMDGLKHIDVTDWSEWGTRSETLPADSKNRSDADLYSAVFERARDVVTGLIPPTQQEAIERIR